MRSYIWDKPSFSNEGMLETASHFLCHEEEKRWLFVKDAEEKFTLIML